MPDIMQEFMVIDNPFANLGDFTHILGGEYSIKDKPVFDANTPIHTLYGMHLVKSNEDAFTRKKPSCYAIPYETLVGVEVEVEGIDEPISMYPMWDKKEDGSLRNFGIEYITFPTPAKYIPIAIESLYKALYKTNNPVFSDRTSIHVHVNVQDMTLEQLKVFTLLYLSVENLLYDYVGLKRKKSIFCVPLSHSGYVSQLRAFFNSQNPAEMQRCLKQWHKYTGFNLLTVLTYGTVECRHLYGTEDIQKIINWINLILQLREKASSLSLEKLFATIVDLNTSSEYEVYLSNILGERRASLTAYSIKDFMEKDVTYIKTILNTPQQIVATASFEQSKLFSLYGTLKNKIKNNIEFYEPEVLSTLSIDKLDKLARQVVAKYSSSQDVFERKRLDTYYSLLMKERSLKLIQIGEF